MGPRICQFSNLKLWDKHCLLSEWLCSENIDSNLLKNHSKSDEKLFLNPFKSGKYTKIYTIFTIWKAWKYIRSIWFYEISSAKSTFEWKSLRKSFSEIMLFFSASCRKAFLKYWFSFRHLAEKLSRNNDFLFGTLPKSFPRKGIQNGNTFRQGAEKEIRK